MRARFLSFALPLLALCTQARAHGDAPGTCADLAPTYLARVTLAAGGVATELEPEAPAAISAVHAEGYAVTILLSTLEPAGTPRSLWYAHTAFGFSLGRCVPLPAGETSTAVQLPAVTWSAGTSGLRQHVRISTADVYPGLGYTVDWR